MMALLDFDKLAAQYAAELEQEGVPLSAPISPAAVLSDLARIAGVPTPWIVTQEAPALVEALECWEGA